MEFFFLKLAIIFIVSGKGSALKDVKVVIPTAVERGHKSVMKCLFDLEGEALYSVKWYKGEREFFRYTPKEVPSTKYFPIPNLTVVEYESNATQVVLDDVQLENSGGYYCEITADSPGFYTRVVYGDLQVVISPREDPKITKIKTKYRLGDTLKGQCISRDSKPAANLTWFINGRPAMPTYTRHQKPKINEIGLETAISQVQHTIKKELFSAGRLKIKCSAMIYNVYHRSFEMSIELDKPKPKIFIPMSTPETMGFSGGNGQESGNLLTPNEASSSNSLKNRSMNYIYFTMIFIMFLLLDTR